jgi:hypothetical protein
MAALDATSTTARPLMPAPAIFDRPTGANRDVTRSVQIRINERQRIKLGQRLIQHGCMERKTRQERRNQQGSCQTALLHCPNLEP